MLFLCKKNTKKNQRSMHLIADSGSTKTQWCLIENGHILNDIKTNGINPFYQTQEEIVSDLENQLLPQLDNCDIKGIHFYGAGCSFPEKKVIVSSALGKHFSKTEIDIESDLLGAARSLFQHEKGIACILGTGSNSCFYDGNEIIQNVSPLGYILGDEGSGAVLGRLLIADCLKNQLPDLLREKLLDKYNLTPAQILENVYKKPFPNRFLAKFAPFILEHIEEPSLFNLVYDSFDSFLVRNVMQYPLDEIKVGFIGSIAYYFRDTLEIVASERGIVISEIAKSPMEGLVEYHKMTPKP